jgi:hypothetical protein
MDEEIRTRRLRCTDSFQGNGLVRPADLLASIPPNTEEDLYGEGGAVTDLERYVADLLGKPRRRPCAYTRTGGSPGPSSGIRSVT